MTTSLVVAEGHAWFLKRYDRLRAMAFLGMLEAMPFLKVLAVGPADIEAASAVMRKLSDQDLTLADAVGLSLMKARGSRSCWSTDFQLGLLGVPLVIHNP